MTGSAEHAADAGPTTETGPLGPTDAARPGAPADEPRTPFWSAMGTVVVGLAGLAASLVVLGTLAEDIRARKVFAIDTWATPFLHGAANPALDLLMNALTWMGSAAVLVPGFILAAVLLLGARRYRALLFLAISCGGALLLNGAMKLFFQRPRPSPPWAAVLPDYSFPSGHTMNAVVFYAALALIAWSAFGRGVGWCALAAAIVLALGVGLSRIYLGYHYVTDVVGGLLAGTAWLLVVGTALRARPAWHRWRGSGRPSGADSRAES